MFLSQLTKLMHYLQSDELLSLSKISFYTEIIYDSSIKYEITHILIVLQLTLHFRLCATYTTQV